MDVGSNMGWTRRDHLVMHTKDELKQKLATLGVATLADFIAALHAQHPELNEAIETLLLYQDPLALEEALAARIQRIGRSRKAIDDHGSFQIARQLNSLLIDIESVLLAYSPERAFALVDALLETSEAVFSRAHHTGGALDDVYGDAVMLWLRAAARWQDAEINWLERVFQLHRRDGYGALGTVLENAQLVLSQEQLRQLAWRYESACLRAIKHPESDDGDVDSAHMNAHALRLLSEAMDDPILFERSILIRSPKPSHPQIREICNRYLRDGQLEPAMRYLERPWRGYSESERLRLLDQVYTQSGDLDRRKEVRRQLFEITQDAATFRHYLDVLDPEEQRRAKEEASKTAESGKHLTQGAHLLLSIKHSERAAQLVLLRHRELVDCFCDDVLRLAKAFEKDKQDLAALACYRALVLQVLALGRTKGYGQGARHYKKLIALSERLQGFGPLMEHQAFVQHLRATHGRKVSFWARVEG